MPGRASRKGGELRSGSGRRRDSTRTTVAPYSARYPVVIGPTATQKKSSTFRPSSGCISDRSDLSQSAELRRREPELVDVDLGVVLADPRREAAPLERRGARVDERARERHGRPELRV